MKYQNKIVIITGGGTGIGKETARSFLAEGAKVVINGRRESVLRDTARELDPSGDRIRTVAGSIGKKAVAEKLIKTAVEAFGGVDILINNAGIFRPTPFLDHTEEDVDSFIEIILKGTFYASQAAIPEIRKRGGGAIVNIGSLWADQAVNATPSTAYSAAKAGVHALTRNLALEFASDNIRVNNIAPGVVETPVYNTFMSDEQVAETLPTFNAFYPLGRNGQPADIVSAILFLAGSDSSWITGTTLSVDGGVTAGRH